MNIILNLFILAGFHILDMLSTVLYLKELKKQDQNAEDSEVNFHRYFFKKFGIIKGALISICISMPILLLFGYITLIYIGELFFVYILGIITGIFRVNIASWDLIRKDNKKK